MTCLDKAFVALLLSKWVKLEVPININITKTTPESGGKPARGRQTENLGEKASFFLGGW